MKTKKLPLIVLFSCLVCLAPCFADEGAREDIIKEFANEVQKSLPFASLAPLSWSDAYIGQFISRKPHFGFGVAYGMSVADFQSLRSLAKDAGAQMLLDTGAVMMPPLYGIARLGGFFVPFDIGVAASIPGLRSAEGAAVQNLAADIRFAVITENERAPNISIGVSYAFSEGNFTAQAQRDTLNIDWMANAVELKLQVSKPIQAWTPYGIAAVGFTWSRAGYRIEDRNGVITEVAGMAQDDYLSGILLRVVGGASIKFALFRLDVAAHLSAPSFDYASVLSFRFQL